MIQTRVMLVLGLVVGMVVGTTFPLIGEMLLCLSALSQYHSMSMNLNSLGYIVSEVRSVVLLLSIATCIRGDDDPSFKGCVEGDTMLATLEMVARFCFAGSGHDIFDKGGEDKIWVGFVSKLDLHCGMTFGIWLLRALCPWLVWRQWHAASVGSTACA